MKGCILLQRRFSVFGHALAKLLKEKYGVEEFCGYTYLRDAEKFLKSQKDINYEPLLVDEDLYHLARKEKLDPAYLKSIEKEYGIPNFWPFITIDRYFMMSWPKYKYSNIPACGHEEMLKQLQVRFKAITKMLKEQKPDFVVFSAVGSMGSLILYWVAKKMGIQTINIDHTRVQNRVTLTDNCYNIFTDTNKIFNDYQEGRRQPPSKDKSIKFLEDFRRNPNIRVWEKLDSLSFVPRFLRWAKFFAEYITSYIKEGKWEDYHIEDPLSYFRNRLTTRLRKLQGIDNFFEDPRREEDFVFLPLHQEPEVATLLLAPFSADQLILAKNIAKSLPVNFKLYVKEHPAMLYYRPSSYYKELKKIPNVRLIDVKTDSISLIKKAKLTLTISGTAGFEAVLLKKPVITFGSVFYNELSTVNYSDKSNELSGLIKDSLENHRHDDEELVNFLSAIFEDSIPLNYGYLWHDAGFEEIVQDKEFGSFVDFLAKKLRLSRIVLQVTE